MTDKRERNRGTAIFPPMGTTSGVPAAIAKENGKKLLYLPSVISSPLLSLIPSSIFRRKACQEILRSLHSTSIDVYRSIYTPPTLNHRRFLLSTSLRLFCFLKVHDEKMFYHQFLIMNFQLSCHGNW